MEESSIQYSCRVDAAVCVRLRTSDVCAENFSHSARLLLPAIPSFFYARLVPHVDSAKIKVPFYTADIDILRVTLIHCIDILIHIEESLHP